MSVSSESSYGSAKISSSVSESMSSVSVVCCDGEIPATVTATMLYYSDGQTYITNLVYNNGVWSGEITVDSGDVITLTWHCTVTEGIPMGAMYLDVVRDDGVQDTNVEGGMTRWKRVIH